MIKKIKNKIKRFVDIRVRLLRDQQHRNQQIVFNYNQLNQLFSEDSFIPFSAWAISPSTILHVLNDISINKRKRIIEFGSGASTLYIAKLLKVLKSDAVFYSVESDKQWAIDLEKQLELYNISGFVRIIYAPITKVSEMYSFKEQETWYDTEILEKALDSQKEFDLVLVDGPFGGSTPYARYSAIPFLEKCLSKQASIFLDDIQRNDETEILKEWEKLLGQNSIINERYACITKQSGFDVSPFQLSNPFL